jgi:diaminohydroxyphosphoribosylaminopyrimidine deaminase/5-amino-6-(5-phosphoribosylamino)uracil reductase
LTDDARVIAAMRRALDIARFGPDNTQNPQVGCVIINAEGRGVAEGWHQGAGTAHAEVNALEQLSEAWIARASELTAVITLEPCNHTGLTGPCSHALVDAGITRVVYATDDPSPCASGGGAYLRAHGVAVRSGVLHEDAELLIASWRARRGLENQSSQPFVTVKWAQSLDGRAAATDGSSQWITAPQARADVHARRAAADAIMVGGGTLRADDPTLTARDAHGHLLVSPKQQPIPVVVSNTPIPRGARIMDHPALAAHQLTQPIQLTGANLTEEIQSLAQYGIRSVFVEGGPALISALIADNLVDQVLVYTAPKLLGGPATALGNIGVASIDNAITLCVAERVPLGPDELVIARPATTPRALGTASGAEHTTSFRERGNADVHGAY